jgi:hypothetical protein
MAVTLPVPILNPSKKIPGRKRANNFENLLRMEELTDEFLGIILSEDFVILFSR